MDRGGVGKNIMFSTLEKPIKFNVRRKGVDSQKDKIKNNYALPETATAEPRNRERKIRKIEKRDPLFSLEAAVFIFSVLF